MTSRPRLEALAQRLDVDAAWDDVVLPEEELRQLRRLAEEVLQRSEVFPKRDGSSVPDSHPGITALFQCGSGLGGITAAKAIAKAVGFDLYRIDLSDVVSKYIGETEKNLRRLFDAAEEGGPILIFDEAGALFGERGQTNKGDDCYFNESAVLLLGYIETYRGLGIIATGLTLSYSQEVIQRLQFIVNFPPESPSSRS